MQYSFPCPPQPVPFDPTSWTIDSRANSLLGWSSTGISVLRSFIGASQGRTLRLEFRNPKLAGNPNVTQSSPPGQSPLNL